MKTQNIITFSAARKLYSCPRAYDNRYNKFLVPKKKSEALSFGSLIHEVLAMWYRGSDRDSVIAWIDAQREVSETDERKMQQWILAKAMTVGYLNRYPKEAFNVLEVEKTISGPVFPGYGATRSARGWSYAGKIDALVEWEGKRYLLEHKTSSVMTDDFLDTLWMCSQIAIYSSYVPVDGVIYNILNKCKLRKRQGDTDEDYYERLLEWYSQKEAFHRENIVIPESRQIQARNELYEAVELIRHFDKRGYYPPNTGNCTMYGKCAYYKYCAYEMSDDVRDEYYDRVPPHEELDLEEIPEEIL